jgi:hypothetical protein
MVENELDEMTCVVDSAELASVEGGDGWICGTGPKPPLPLHPPDPM